MASLGLRGPRELDCFSRWILLEPSFIAIKTYFKYRRGMDYGFAQKNAGWWASRVLWTSELERRGDSWDVDEIICRSQDVKYRSYLYMQKRNSELKKMRSSRLLQNCRNSSYITFKHPRSHGWFSRWTISSPLRFQSKWQNRRRARCYSCTSEDRILRPKLVLKRRCPHVW